MLSFQRDEFAKAARQLQTDDLGQYIEAKLNGSSKKSKCFKKIDPFSFEPIEKQQFCNKLKKYGVKIDEYMTNLAAKNNDLKEVIECGPVDKPSMAKPKRSHSDSSSNSESSELRRNIKKARYGNEASANVDDADDDDEKDENNNYINLTQQN
jgi:hypothetical protein